MNNKTTNDGTTRLTLELLLAILSLVFCVVQGIIGSFNDVWLLCYENSTLFWSWSFMMFFGGISFGIFLTIYIQNRTSRVRSIAQQVVDDNIPEVSKDEIVDHIHKI